MTMFAHIDCVVRLGFAVVARITEHRGGNSELILVLATDLVFASYCRSPWPTQMCSINEMPQPSVWTMEASVGNSEIDSPLSEISIIHTVPHAPSTSPRPVPRRPRPLKVRPPPEGNFEVEDSVFPIQPLKVDQANVGPPMISAQRWQQQAWTHRIQFQPLQSHIQECHHLRILIVEARPISYTFGRL